MRFRIGGSRLSSAAAFAVALLLVVAAAVVAQFNLQRLRNSFGWVEHTQQVLLQIAQSTPTWRPRWRRSRRVCWPAAAVHSNSQRSANSVPSSAHT